MKLITERLILRQATLSDAHDIFTYRSNPAIHQFLSSEPKNIGDIEHFISNSAKKLNEPGTWFQVAIVHKETNKAIGDIGLHFIDSEPHQEVEIGYTLSPLFHKQGIATEAVQEIISFLFNKLQKHRIIASVDPLNSPSFRMLEKLGFRKEAHFKKSLFFKGEWVDDLVYGLLAEEWKLRKKR
jgi:RimJ/RimL family protein N-acetyltransferase